MIDITTIASGSKGNCYLVDDGKTPLLLECGISIKEIRKGTEFRLGEVEGCLITHEHQDHIKSAVDVAGCGIDCYMSKGTFDNYGFGSHRFNIVELQHVSGKQKIYKPFKIKTWTVKPFEAQHDVEEHLGYLLANQAGEKLLFATDTFYLKYKFQGLTHIMIECNYALDILNENIRSGRVPAVQKKRLLKSHFSLENVKGFLRANDLSKVEEIHLLHLSDRNSDEERFKREIQELTGKVVYIA
ncbi:MBL fold metallo-hydrolase [Orenia marismortui]|uniref:Phosphoribosyl 1,2-cyclic phosphodiesterase n=1 Tax=Orenia marismortui TaxID=46469 RepID=A0A4R8GZH4_9FIRM|nr:MBL fold metallo-hydrolase [Orenia marismortui]TDX52161.1 phosphoribosyl 1,2-cyclic phosphodiesterase [Orenia marismortui]